MKPIVLSVLGLVFLSACQSTMLNDDRIASQTAGVLGVPAPQITISDRASQGPTNTSYIAHDTKSGATYACVINGGGLLAAGMTNPPSCNKQ
jgi:hypothetical protein